MNYKNNNQREILFIGNKSCAKKYFYLNVLKLFSFVKYC